MRALRWLALIVVIHATLPANDAVMDAVELLRDAAKKAGCADPRVAMRSTGNGSLEIEVRCADGGVNGR